jgi:hypothetical protein
MAYAPDHYETDRREVVGSTLAEAVAWAKANPEAFARTNIWWVRDDDCEAIVVDRDIQDEINFATGEWVEPADAAKLAEVA